jgi:hypothetical protein
MSEHWGGLRPALVSKLINFDADNADWYYDAGARPSMASRQAEGVAYLWNLLSKYGVALLADEVGTGKTYQALGVAALLWRMKPDAKVLVMAPNHDVCENWRIEFNTFVEIHYRHADGRVKALTDGKPVPRLEVHSQLRSLASAIETGTARAQLHVATIHALSGLVDDPNEIDKTGAARRAAEAINQRILKALDGGGFDLVIVDEAHYLRNKGGGAQRVAAATGFFGLPGCRISSHALLLTATPSHTQLGDVANILSYFVDFGEAEHWPPAEEVMRQYALRRFRIMAGTGHTKHQYRREIATPCDFTGRPEAEVFFALYQRKLIHDLKLMHEKHRPLYGFLEGVESSGPDDRVHAGAKDNAAPSENEAAHDFSSAPDTKLLRQMNEEFASIFKRAPDHPKYGGLVDQCVPRQLFPTAPDRPLHEDKHLVFVRRIPSVRELTNRINKQYDDMLAQKICAAWDLDADDPRVLRWSAQNWSRDGFNELLQHKPGVAVETGADNAAGLDHDSENDDEGEGEGAQPAPHDAYLGSKIADLFVTKKASEKQPAPTPTDCSRFSLALRRSNSIYAMFMEPASDYLAGRYTEYVDVRQGDKSRADYTKAARARRLEAHGLLEKKELEQLRPRAEVTRNYEEPIETLWSIVFPHLSERQQATLHRWATSQPAVAEDFGNYVQAGFLFASPVVVELYCWHTRLQRSLPARDQHANVQQRYQDFVAHVRANITDSLLLKYFGAALDGFEQLCRKIVKSKSEDLKKRWRTLTTLSNPAWYASGESSSRQHLILGFNSPFYPNTLVATSVFQEGINLHLQCRKVHHYGIAWTPGDNEQRVGRVDRLFGKVNELLKAAPSVAAMPTLDIDYPYLKNSFDEDQVGSFIERKHAVEEKMDRCLQRTFDKEVRLTRPGWQDFLRQPVAESALQDPYPARFDVKDMPSGTYPEDMDGC